jgi:hypothetical protein
VMSKLRPEENERASCSYLGKMSPGRDKSRHEGPVVGGASRCLEWQEPGRWAEEWEEGQT